MFRKVKVIMIAAILNLGFVFVGGFSSVAFANSHVPITDTVACGASGSLTAVTNCKDPTADVTINATVKRAIQLFQIVVGLISVFMLIFGGLKYITSGGESSNVQGAKNTILYAVIGLVVVGLAQVIVTFVLNRVTSAPNTI